MVDFLTVDRLVGGLDGGFGRFAGSQLVRDVDLLDDIGMQLGDLTGEYGAHFQRSCPP
jgi:hypothetical protein